MNLDVTPDDDFRKICAGSLLVNEYQGIEGMLLKSLSFLTSELGSRISGEKTPLNPEIMEASAESIINIMNWVLSLNLEHSLNEHIKKKLAELKETMVYQTLGAKND